MADLNCSQKFEWISVSVLAGSDDNFNVSLHYVTYCNLIFYVPLFTFDSMESVPSETKIIYYLDDEPIPYRIKISVDPQSITLADIKRVLVRSNCKYFFKSLDADFGYCVHTGFCWCQDTSDPGHFGPKTFRHWCRSVRKEDNLTTGNAGSSYGKEDGCACVITRIRLRLYSSVKISTRSISVPP